MFLVLRIQTRELFASGNTDEFRVQDVLGDRGKMTSPSLGILLTIQLHIVPRLSALVRKKAFHF